MMWMPIHKWTHEEVFAMHDKHGIPPNPLYRNGMGRVGCWPCIMCRKQELAAIAKRFPECFDELQEKENRVAEAVGKPKMSFFSNYKTPEKFHSETCDKTGKSFPSATDVRLWALGEEPANSKQPMLFEEDDTEDAYACTSQYGLCE
jgi:3'-phosphoadenosine 5'-phosphosulfate sulfotransferase (PAPS reductase)/FAD synthetase